MTKDRAAKREERRLAKQQKAQRLADKYSDQHNTSKELKQSQEIEPPKIPITPENRKETLKKLPVFKEKPSIYDSKLTWCTSITDIEDAWSWGEPRNWSDEEWQGEIIREMVLLSDLTWSEIARMETGEGKKRKRRKRHHPQQVDSITPEAQKRWRELDLNQFDTAYRFRLGGTKRIWGIQYGSHFYMVWYERNHLIYPTS
ncbi:hypothetical protein ACB288_20440 [Aeromonas taiwanensis]|uniref:hypothetical protein n=1 Tax=Aeromonas TaxID=642 RepID=UPI001CC5C79D|nr:hypothetical protein [Aeromonas hydrophila]GJC07027.1 hypothetical protein KAM385_40560 [Aeromonas hydrophila]